MDVHELWDALLLGKNSWVLPLPSLVLLCSNLMLSFLPPQLVHLPRSSLHPQHNLRETIPSPPPSPSLTQFKGTSSLSVPYQSIYQVQMVTQSVQILRVWTYDVRQFGIKPGESATDLQEWLAHFVPAGKWPVFFFRPREPSGGQLFEEGR
jgi:hypothetical protein